MSARGDENDSSFKDLVARDVVPMSPSSGLAGVHGPAAPSEAKSLGNVLELDHVACESDAKVWSIPNLPAGRLQRLKRGGAKRRLDLHGMTVEQAWQFLNVELADCVIQGRSLVEIIHGAGTGRLKVKVRGWLERSGWVLGYAEGRRNPHSVTLLLKRHR